MRNANRRLRRKQTLHENKHIKKKSKNIHHRQTILVTRNAIIIPD